MCYIAISFWAAAATVGQYTAFSSFKIIHDAVRSSPAHSGRIAWIHQQSHAYDSLSKQDIF